MQVERKPLPFMFITADVRFVHQLEAFGLKNVAQCNGSLIGKSFENRNLNLGIQIIRIATSEEPKANCLVVQFQGQKEAQPSMKMICTDRIREKIKTRRYTLQKF